MTKKYVLASISINLTIILSIFLIIGVFKIELLSNIKIIFTLLFLILLVIFSIISYLCKNKNIYNIGIFVNLIINIILIYNTVNLNIKYDYILNLFNKEYKYITYNVYVQKRTPIYNNLNKLENQKIGMLSKNQDNIKNYLDKIISIEYISYQNTDEIANAIDNGEIQCFILTDDDFLKIDNDKINIKNRVRKIYTNKIKDTN
mgnify:CR=1 FL=1